VGCEIEVGEMGGEGRQERKGVRRGYSIRSYHRYYEHIAASRTTAKKFAADKAGAGM